MTDAELDALVACLRELATYYEVATEAENAITTLRAQLADARAERDDAIIKRAAWELEAKIQQARADRAEAALAAQIETDAGVVRSLDNGLSDGKWLEYNLALLRASDKIRNQPHDRSALDRMLADAREKALREAYDSLFKHPGFLHKISGQTFKAVKLEDAAEAILALIEKPNAR